MADKVITSLDHVTTEWLTSVLSQSGALTRGVVASFESGTGKGNWSTNANLIVKYSDGAQGSLPRRLFLKMVNTDLDDESFGESEVTYYTRDYVDVVNAPLIRCYDAVFSEQKNRYHILLDDLSETHIEAAEKEATLEYGLALVEGLAAMHARWWGAERLAEAGVTMHSPAHIQNFVTIAEPGVNHILNRFSADLKPDWPHAMHELYLKHPQAMINRTKTPTALLSFTVTWAPKIYLFHEMGIARSTSLTASLSIGVLPPGWVCTILPMPSYLIGKPRPADYMRCPFSGIITNT